MMQRISGFQPIETNRQLINDVVTIIEHARTHAYTAINIDLVKRNWLLGKRITEEELFGEERAEYGKKTIKNLSLLLSEQFGKGFDYSELYRCIKVYNMFTDLFTATAQLSVKEILETLSPKSETNILELLSPKSPHTLLSWSHYCKLLQVVDNEMRQWYANECANEFWSVRTLQRNISSQYCQRLLNSHGKNKLVVRDEMKNLTSSMQNNPVDFIKNPVVIEFLGLSDNTSFRESTLETAIINNLQKFLMEMGKGWAFVARQQHIHTEKEDYFIDIVFYNVILKCYILIDLKTEKISYQDVGQMDMYVKMYDEIKRTEGDSPTLGLILCADTDEDVVKYAMRDKEQLFASKYITYMPTKEQLRSEIERQKELFRLQQENN